MHFGGWGKARQDKVLICSDSSSVLACLRSFHSNSRQDVLYEVLQSVTGIANQKGQVQFLWVPAHAGVRGNERVDELAKRALKKGNLEMQISISKAEVKCLIWEKTTKCGRKGGTERGKGGIYIKFKRVSKLLG